MPIPCRLVPKDQYPKRPGDMWFDGPPVKSETGDWYYCSDGRLGTNYVRDWLGKREPIIVMLPNNEPFGVDTSPSSGDTTGWTVAGEAPNITVQPSINAIGRYHGFLVNGVFTDDPQMVMNTWGLEQ